MFYLGIVGPLGLPVSTPEIYRLPEDTYTIFSFCARSRSLALGAVETTINGFDGETNLESFGYDWQHYSHSKQFRSNIVDERPYWDQVAEDFDLTVHHPEE